MSEPDTECMHGLLLGTCSLCKTPRGPSRTGRTRGSTISRTLDTPESVERYRPRYPGDREATFDAYVEVFFSRTDARSFPGGWTYFSRCANAEPALERDEPQLVGRAEEIMRQAGYTPDDSGRPAKGRRWIRTS